MKTRKPLLTKPDIDWLINSMKLIFATRDEVSKKFDDVSKKLDTFIGEIKTRREEQTLHANQHRTINDRLETIMQRIGIPIE